MVSDEQLMVAYVDGDDEAFRELFARCSGRLPPFLGGRLPDRRTTTESSTGIPASS